MTRRPTAATAFPVVLMGWLLVAGYAAPPPLLDEAGPIVSVKKAGPAHVLRERTGRMDPSALPGPGATRGAQTLLNFFSDAQMVADWLHLDRHASENFAWHGKLLEDLSSAVTLTVVGEATVLTVISPVYGQFELRSPGDGLGEVRQFDQEQLKGNGRCFITNTVCSRTVATATTATPPELSAVTPATIDVLMIYTARARQLAGGRSAIVAIAQSAVNGQNGFFNSSDIAHRMRLVQAREVGHTASGDLGTELGWLAGNSNVASIRDEVGADLVAFLSDKDDSGVRGLAFQLTSTSGNDQQVYSANYYDTASGVWPHEAGHNLGCAHNEPGLYSYSSGHYWLHSNGNTYGSLMSYIGIRVPRFSNPDVNHWTGTTGTASRDNARSIDNIGDSVAAYRTAKTLIEPSCTIATSTASPPEDYDFTLTVKADNGGPSTATACRMAVNLPGWLTLVSHNGAAAFDPASGIWDVPNLADGGSVTLNLTVHANPGSAGRTLSPSVEVSSAGSGFVDFDVYNNTDSVTVVPVSGLPVSPTGLSASPGPGLVALRWLPSMHATSYDIKRSATSGGPYVVVTSGINDLHYTDTGLLNGSTNYYVVSGRNTLGPGDNSSEAAAVPGRAREPLADAPVRGGAYANDNYGQAGLVVKVDAADYTRQSFLLFDVSGMTGMKSVTLRLVPVSVGSSAGSTKLAFETVNQDDWTENGITWNNKPAGSGTILTNLTGFQVSVPVAIDVTAVTLTQAAGDGLLSLWIRSTVSGSNRMVTFGSREQGDATLRPMLVYTQPVPPLSISGAGPHLTLSWPLSGAGFAVYSTTNLMSPSSWLPVTNAIVPQASVFMVELTFDDVRRYFRLATP